MLICHIYSIFGRYFMNKVFTYFALFILLTTLPMSCATFERKTQKGVLLEVADTKLYIEEVNKIIPDNTSPEDSIKLTDRYIERWVTDALMYELAKQNNTNDDEINKLVAEYKKSLVLFNYEQNILKQNITDSISENELHAFYESFSDEFILDENLIKGLFLVVAKDAPRLNDVKKWLNSADTEALENIEKYVIENIASYDYFMDEWLKFNDIVRYYPEKIENKEQFLKNNSFVSFSDSTKTYFWRIKEYRLVGETEPYEYAQDKIQQILLNKERINYIQNLKKSLYQRAINNGEVKFMHELK